MIRDFLTQLFQICASYPVLMTAVCLLLSVFVGSVLLVIVNLHASKRTHRFQMELGSLQYHNKTLADQITVLAEDKERLKAECRDIQAKERSTSLELAEERSRASEKQKHFSEEIARLTALKQSLVLEFESVVSKQIAKQQSEFVENSGLRLDGLLNPLQRQVGEFRARLDEVHRVDIEQTHQLLGQIKQLQSQSIKIGEDASQLTKALKGDNKLMGNWGEWVLKRILEGSGLQEGREFKVQASYSSSEGRRLQPDVILLLPEERHIIIDSKVSLLAYESLVGDNLDNRSVVEADLIASLRQHISSLAKKRYDQMPGVSSLDFVIMFVPVEAAFNLAVKLNPDLLMEAYNKNIVIAGPSSLTAILRCIQSLWQREKQDRNVDEIVTEAGKLHDQFVRFVDALEEVGGAIAKAQTAYDKAQLRLVEGRGNLVKRTHALRALGAKTQKKLAQELIERAEG